MKTKVRESGVPAVLKNSATMLAALLAAVAVTAVATEAQTSLRTGRDAMAANTAAIIKPFQNSTDSVSIDELIVENGEDRIAVYGALNITRDKEGLRRARELKALLDETVKTLSSENLPDHIAIKPVEKTENPFR